MSMTLHHDAKMNNKYYMVFNKWKLFWISGSDTSGVDISHAPLLRLHTKKLIFVTDWMGSAPNL